jgi:hypothetical protein
MPMLSDMQAAYVAVVIAPQIRALMGNQLVFFSC